MNYHNEFILSPITKVLEDAITASSAIGSGIETYPLCDYIMQSIFLKMTGFQEQKMKCISWELASNDYEYRYEFTKNPLGECSSYKEKQLVYKNLTRLIKKYNRAFSPQIHINRESILIDSIAEVKTIFSNTNLSIWAQKSYNECMEICNEIKVTHFINDNNTLFAETPNSVTLKQMYENHLYVNRNRCAHNTHSYQQNLPTLKKLSDDNYMYDNYFVWFVILVLIDKIFSILYHEYLERLKERQ